MLLRQPEQSRCGLLKKAKKGITPVTEQYTNQAHSTLAAPYSKSAAPKTMTLRNASSFPANGLFSISVGPLNSALQNPIYTVIAVDGDVLTLADEVEAGTDVNAKVGAPVVGVITKRAMDQIKSDLIRFRGAVNLSVNGTLAIGSDLAPRVPVLDATRIRGVWVECKQAPLGAGITVRISSGDNAWMTLTIPDGATMIQATAAELAAATEIPGGASIRLDIRAVGTTFPGADLSVSLFV